MYFFVHFIESILKITFCGWPVELLHSE